ncbi:hypothetical protein FB45DRAFT_1029612 [Roridomyces roridus]|uniref:Uncharacterized protein n=1 Tax=Roridomyces roridus TaxID=1738132 RepID=A0AAD7BQ35_9AGAR|nr:hypothetical protein FB45DRAFT_1029612 [Roridomyces roridus]
MSQETQVIQIQALQYRRRREPKKMSQPSPDDVPHGWDPDVIHTLGPSRSSADDAVERAARICARAEVAAKARRSADDKLVRLLNAGPEGRRKHKLAKEIRRNGKAASTSKASTSSK